MRVFEANKACKQINGLMILENLTIGIEQGEKIAITGQNGSGKSSLLKLIAGIYEETDGKVNRAKVEIGYVPEHFPENTRFKLQEYLMLMGRMSGKSEEELLRKITSYAEHFGISTYLSVPLKNCSKGTKQKVGIIQALLKEPELLLMDEPLTGLDEASQIELLSQLHSLKNDIAIIFTAHDLLLIEELAARVIRVDSGRIVSDEVKRKKEKVRIIKARIPSIEAIAGMDCISQTFIEDDVVEILVATEDSDKVLSMLLEKNCSILELIERR